MNRTLRLRSLAGCRLTRAFTLVEILIVVVILGILAAIISPIFANTALEANITNIRSQLHVLRSAVELHDSRFIQDQFDPLTNQWAQLVNREYINHAPKNPLQDNTTTVANAPAMGVAWVWSDRLYAVDEEGNQMDL